jgi:D-beta-D-heptose 7-phosphate kinase/D-beta-D-heptose 1-phosphate adenosyltransferase
MRNKELSKIPLKFSGKKIIVIGDIMLDRFIYGRVTRISPEAPVPVVEVTSEQFFPGGAANVARNVRALGADVTLVGRLGKDLHGKDLLNLLQSSEISTDGIVCDHTIITNVKTRVIARTQQVVRVDRELRTPLPGNMLPRVSRLIEKCLKTADAVIVEDYGKGFVTQALVETVRQITERFGVLWTADPNPNNPLDWSGSTAVKPNRTEAFATLGRPESRDKFVLQKIAQDLRQKWKTQMVLLTLGEDGMLLSRDGADPYWSACSAKEVFDVSGAGDTAIAAFTLALCSGATPEAAADIANAAAGVVVGKLGTAVVTSKELVQVLESQAPPKRPQI